MNLNFKKLTQIAVLSPPVWQIVRRQFHIIFHSICWLAANCRPTQRQFRLNKVEFVWPPFPESQWNDFSLEKLQIILLFILKITWFGKFWKFCIQCLKYCRRSFEENTRMLNKSTGTRRWFMRRNGEKWRTWRINFGFYLVQNSLT